MAVVPSAGFTVDTASIPWVPMQPKAGGPARSFAKILHIDEGRNLVVMLNRTVGGTTLPTHTHLCEAMAYTLSGRWAYRDADLGAGSFGVEPVGTEHAPEYTEDTEALVIFAGDSPEMLRTVLPDGTEVSTGIDTFVALKRAQDAMMAER